MKSISIVIPLIGEYPELIDNLESAINALDSIQKRVDIIFVSYDSSWRFSPQYQLLNISLKECKVLELDQDLGSLGLMLNKAIETIQTKLTIFIPLNQIDCINDIEAILKYIKNNSLENEIGYVARNEENKEYPSNQVNYGHLQIKKIYNLADLIIPTDILKKFRFNEDELLQYEIDWDISLRLARRYDFVNIIISQYKSKKFTEYPFENHFTISNDIIHRYVLSLGSQENLSQYEIRNMFIRDLKKSDRERVEKSRLKINTENKEENSETPYKITVLGGFWEYHHNQICFFNYFEKAFGTGFCTYKVGFDNEADRDFIEGSDLVIFTRCRSENSIQLIEYCNEKGIATIYMIDDNWISIGKDYPEVYGNLFTKGNPNYDNFIRAISLCDETWCYNEIIEEDISRYAKRTFKFDLNVDTDMYKPLKEKCNDKIIVGYSGSLRSNNEAFEAMVKIAKKYKNIEIVLIGILSKEQEDLFHGLNYERKDFMPYVKYSKMISNISPDILLAPLEDNRTSNSKCFNKYLESATLEAIGVYSKVKPYTDIIEDGVNGYFVEKNTVNSWFDKLEVAILDIQKLRTMQKYAYENVENNYSTSSLLDKFKKEIERVVEGIK